MPADLDATISSGISAIGYCRLKQYLGFTKGHTRVYDVVQQLARVEDSIIEQYQIDAVYLGRAFNTREEDWQDHLLPDGTPVQFPFWFHPKMRPNGDLEVFAPDGDRIAIMPFGGEFFDQTCFPYQNRYPGNYLELPEAMKKVHWSGIPLIPWDHAVEELYWQKLRENATRLREGGRAVLVSCGCSLFQWGTFLRRIDNFLMDLLICPNDVERLLDALVERHLILLEKVCSSLGDVVDILRIGEDLGTDQGPFFSPVIYRKMFKPRHKVICDFIRQHSQMHIFLHSCGSIYKLIPDLIEAGFEIFNPIQLTARDMEPVKLKKEFGSEITFWGGGCDTRMVLPRGTTEEVKDHVRANIEALAPGGGYVFAASHNILSDVPPQNIVAMLDAVNEYR